MSTSGQRQGQHFKDAEDALFWEFCLDHQDKGHFLRVIVTPAALERKFGTLWYHHDHGNHGCFVIDNKVIICYHQPGSQQDQIIKGLEAARAKLKEKIAMYKKKQVRVTNELHEQHVLIATLKSQNEGLKEQLELLKSEHANWREYESLKGTSTTPFKHKNEGLKEQLELLKSECANWREYESLKGISTTSSKHKVPTSHPAHPASGSAIGAADTPMC
eukprot:m51a1_g12036 hypothetical protein (218) ;mRNA; f:537-18142